LQQHPRQFFGIHLLLLLFALGTVTITGHAEDAPGVALTANAGGDILPGAPESPQAASAAPAAAPVPAQRGFFTRLGHAYVDDWMGYSNGVPAAPAPAPERRGTPPPLNSPPFPSGDWPIGGTVEIGAPDYGT
jgi:hypothetical protein